MSAKSLRALREPTEIVQLPRARPKGTYTSLQARAGVRIPRSDTVDSTTVGSSDIFALTINEPGRRFDSPAGR